MIPETNYKTINIDVLMT